LRPYGYIKKVLQIERRGNRGNKEFGDVGDLVASARGRKRSQGEGTRGQTVTCQTIIHGQKIYRTAIGGKMNGFDKGLRKKKRWTEAADSRRMGKKSGERVRHTRGRMETASKASGICRKRKPPEIKTGRRGRMEYVWNVQKGPCSQVRSVLTPKSGEAARTLEALADMKSEISASVKNE